MILEISLITILLLVLLLPVTVHFFEKNLEAFLFIMGIFAVTASHYFCGTPVWSLHLVREAFAEPVMITSAVLVVGMLVLFYKGPITRIIVSVEHSLGSKLFCFFLITVLGLVSSVITAIMAAILLCEVISALHFDKRFEVKLVVLCCFSIGLGAALTPIGEPLSTICIAKLKGEPYHADFFFLLRNLGIYIFPGILGLGIIGAIIEPSVKENAASGGLTEERSETWKDIVVAAGKVYLFIMALILLGAGFKPIIDKYIIKLPSAYLYWINTLSAVMDNATLAAAEISPQMSLSQIKYVLMGLLVAGGMLIPGNIPNIISAGRLRITSKEWAKIGLPLGFVLMLVYFAIFSYIQ